MKKNKLKSIVYLILMISITGIIFIGCENDEDDAEGKTYSSSAAGYGGDVKVDVTVGSDGKINAVKVDAEKETPEVGGAAASTVAKQIVAEQSLAVDAVAGATITSNAVITATENALKEAGVDTEALKK